MSHSKSGTLEGISEWWFTNLSSHQVQLYHSELHQNLNSYEEEEKWAKKRPIKLKMSNSKPGIQIKSNQVYHYEFIQYLNMHNISPAGFESATFAVNCTYSKIFILICKITNVRSSNPFFSLLLPHSSLFLNFQKFKIGQKFLDSTFPENVSDHGKSFCMSGYVFKLFSEQGERFFKPVLFFSPATFTPFLLWRQIPILEYNLPGRLARWRMLFSTLMPPKKDCGF